MSDFPYSCFLDLLGGHIWVRCRHHECLEGIVRHFSCNLSTGRTLTPDIVVECDWEKATRYLFWSRPTPVTEALEGVRVLVAKHETRMRPWLSAYPPLLPMDVPPFVDRFVGLHSAAVVAPDGHALLFVGERKSGKSTLAVDFVNQAGCQLLTDEIVYLHRRTLLVEPFPIALGVKPPGMEHVKGLIPAQEIVKSVAVHQAAATRVIILAPSDTGGRELVPLSEAAAMRELLKHYLDLGADTDEVMITLLRMATSTKVFQFRYRTYEDLFALREMLSSVKATVVESQSPSGLK